MTDRPEGYARLREMLIRHEGLRLKPYRCTEGKLTIGVGHNLEAHGISERIAMILLAEDMAHAVQEASRLPWYNSIGAVRQDVVLNMIFNLGLDRFLEFKRMIAALSAQNYSKAAYEMLDSLWAVQVGPRAVELSNLMRNG